MIDITRNITMMMLPRMIELILHALAQLTEWSNSPLSVASYYQLLKMLHKVHYPIKEQ